MAADWLQSVLVWVQAHPLAAGAAVFAAALAESLFLFGLLVPGALLMFVAGALVGAGALPMWPTLGLAIAGAIAGDSASFALGYAYRGNLRRIPLLQRAPRLAARGEDFLRRHGGKSIILGRFVGPLRPVMPTITGAAGMGPLRFLCIDIVAALGWAPCYILPGVLFGASLDLAAQVAGRLALLLLVVLAAVWLLVWALRWSLVFGAAWGRSHAERLLAWSRRHRRLGLLGPALADPRQPETPALALMAAVLLVLTWVAYSLVWGFASPPYPIRLDALVFHLSQGLHTPWSDFLAQVIAQLSAPGIYLPLAAAIGVALFVLTGRRAAMHWLAAVVFAAILVLGLRVVMTIPTPNAYFLGHSPPSGFAGGHILISTVIYGFLAVLLASPHRPRWRQIYYSAFTALIGLIALSRLYLGLDWASDLAIGLTVAFLWIALLTLGYRRHRPRRVRPRPLLAVLFAAVAAALVSQALYQAGVVSSIKAPARVADNQIADWYTQGYRRLPTQINDLVGRSLTPLNVQARGELQNLRSQLTTAGWQPGVNPTLARSLLWLAPAKPIAELPILPRIHDGRTPDLSYILPISDQAQWILRLWRSSYVSTAPLWVGQAGRQTLTRRLGLLRMTADHAAGPPALLALRDSLQTPKVKILPAPEASSQSPAARQILLWDAATPGHEAGHNTSHNDRISAEFPVPQTPPEHESSQATNP